MTKEERELLRKIRSGSPKEVQKALERLVQLGHLEKIKEPRRFPGR